MVASLTTKPILDGQAGLMDRRVLDLSGTGDGPFLAVQVLAKADGSAVVNPATSDKQDTLAGLVATDASLGGATAAAAGDTGASTTNGFLRWIRDKLVAGLVLAAGSALIGKVDHATTGIGHGSKTVATAGTDVALASSTPAKWVEIQARTTNTGMIAIGAAGVDATVGTGDGVLLAAGESRVYPCDNLADIYVDATVSGEGVRFTYGT